MADNGKEKNLKLRSLVWRYIDKNVINKEVQGLHKVATCKKYFKCLASSTCSLRMHLSSFHRSQNYDLITEEKNMIKKLLLKHKKKEKHNINSLGNLLHSERLQTFCEVGKYYNTKQRTKDFCKFIIVF